MKSIVLCIVLKIAYISGYVTAAPPISRPPSILTAVNANTTELLTLFGSSNSSTLSAVDGEHEYPDTPPDTPFWHVILDANVRLRFGSTKQRYHKDIGALELIQDFIEQIPDYRQRSAPLDSAFWAQPKFGKQNFVKPSPAHRAVLMKVYIKNPTIPLTWDKLTECLEFAKSFAISYPGWDFSFSMWTPAIATPWTSIKLGEFNLETSSIN